MNARRKDPSPRIREAVQLVAAQGGCDEEEALTRLRERAASVQYRVHDYALLVIQGMVRFDSMPSDGSASVA
jgi:AmiR/NasT family two-component response regulator